MRYLTKEFARIARRLGIDDDSLRHAVENADRGLIEAELGNGLIKQRVARAGAGKSGGYRVILHYRRASRSIFLHAFAKSDKANLTPPELEAYRDFAKLLDGLSDAELQAAVDRRGWRVI